MGSVTSRQRNPPTILEKDSALVDGALSVPFTSEARALKRNAASGYSCLVPRPRTLKEPKQSRSFLPSAASCAPRRSVLSAREDNAFSRLARDRTIGKRRIFRRPRCRGLLPFVIQGKPTKVSSLSLDFNSTRILPCGFDSLRMQDP